MFCLCHGNSSKKKEPLINKNVKNNDKQKVHSHGKPVNVEVSIQDKENVNREPQLGRFEPYDKNENLEYHLQGDTEQINSNKTQRHGGGTKKFLYSGPKPRNSPQEEEWNFRYTPNKAPSPSGLDLDEVWSIKKNVIVSKPEKDQKTGIHGLDLNVKKNFYSRYGNIRESDNQGSSLHSNTGDRSDSVKSWNQRAGYSYSYAGNSSANRQSSTPSSKPGASQNGYSHHKDLF